MEELAELAECWRQVYDAQANTMLLVKRYYEDKGNVPRAAEAQILIDAVHSRRTLVDELMAR